MKKRSPECNENSWNKEGYRNGIKLVLYRPLPWIWLGLFSFVLCIHSETRSVAYKRISLIIMSKSYNFFVFCTMSSRNSTQNVKFMNANYAPMRISLTRPTTTAEKNARKVKTQIRNHKAPSNTRRVIRSSWHSRHTLARVSHTHSQSMSGNCGQARQ